MEDWGLRPEEPRTSGIVFKSKGKGGVCTSNKAIEETMRSAYWPCPAGIVLVQRVTLASTSRGPLLTIVTRVGRTRKRKETARVDFDDVSQGSQRHPRHDGAPVNHKSSRLSPCHSLFLSLSVHPVQDPHVYLLSAFPFLSSPCHVICTYFPLAST